MGKKRTVLGIDPGIANTGVAVVSIDGSNFTLHHSQLIQTKSSECAGTRLTAIAAGLIDVLKESDDYTIDAVAIESVFHNKNVSSSLSTAKVIGIAEMVAYSYAMPVLMFTPQQVKAAAGTGFISKKKMAQISKGLLKQNTDASDHEVDAAFCAITGLLHLRLAGSQNNGKL